MVSNGQKKKWITTSVTFDEETITFLNELSKQEERTRSAMIRTLIRECMRTHRVERQHVETVQPIPAPAS